MTTATAPSVDPETLEIPPETLRLISWETMKRLGILPFRLEHGTLHVATDSWRDIELVDHLRILTGCEIKVYAADAQALFRVLERRRAESPLPTAQGLSSHGSLEPIEIVDHLLEAAVRKKVSDVHLEPQAHGLFIRFRIDGVLHTFEEFPETYAGPIISRIKVLAGADIAERRLPQDGRIRTQICGRDIDLRVSTLPGKYGEKTVIRILDKSTTVLDLGGLGMDPMSQSRLEMLIAKPQGMLLVTGPTGSGKTTTLYSILNRLKSPLKNIITLEDPIEYELLASNANEAGITQVQMNTKIGLNFASALRASLRQDPDVLMMGEIRDRESADTAMRAALTGHLVLSTLHTNSAPDTVGRLRDIGIEPYLIASTLMGVLAQRLVRLLCPTCKEAYRPPQRAMEGLFNQSASQTAPLYRAGGCDACQGTGYAGRKGIFELMEVYGDLKRRIHEDQSVERIRKQLQDGGVSTLRENGMALVLEGLTSVEEIFRVAGE